MTFRCLALSLFLQRVFSITFLPTAAKSLTANPASPMAMRTSNSTIETDDAVKKDANAVDSRVALDAEKGPQVAAPVNPWDPSAFPDGGAEAWLAVLGCFCALFVSFGWIGAIGVFQEYYQLHQLKGYSPSQVSWIPSIEACFMFLGGSWVGRIQDLYGPRYLIPVGT